MRKLAITILAPIISGLLLAIAGMYGDVQELKAIEPVRVRQLDRIENKLDSIQSLLINKKGVRINSRSKDAN